MNQVTYELLTKEETLEIMIVRGDTPLMHVQCHSLEEFKKAVDTMSESFRGYFNKH